MTHPEPTSQQSMNQESASSGHSEDSDSPADAPDPYTEWTSLADNQLENNMADRRWQPVLESAKPLCLLLADKFANKFSGKITPKISGIKQMTPFSVSILWTDDAEMAELNMQFRQKQGATNILSFPAFDSLPDRLAETPIFLGDMALGFETLSKESEQNQRPLEHHLAHLFLHGLLHLIGFDHQEQTEAEEMEALEIQLLSEINIPNPYYFAADEKGEVNADV